jgi:hypothetical protein
MGVERRTESLRFQANQVQREVLGLEFRSLPLVRQPHIVLEDERRVSSPTHSGHRTFASTSIYHTCVGASQDGGNKRSRSRQSGAFASIKAMPMECTRVPDMPCRALRIAICGVGFDDVCGVAGRTVSAVDLEALPAKSRFASIAVSSCSLDDVAQLLLTKTVSYAHSLLPYQSSASTFLP